MNVRHMQCSHPVERQSHSAHQLAPKDPNQFHVLLPPIPRMRPLFSSSKFVLESSMKRSSFQIMTVVCPPAIHSRTMNKALLIRGHPSQYSTLLRALPKVHLCHQFRRQNIFSFWNPLVPFRPCPASLVLSNREQHTCHLSMHSWQMDAGLGNCYTMKALPRCILNCCNPFTWCVPQKGPSQRKSYQGQSQVVPDGN